MYRRRYRKKGGVAIEKRLNHDDISLDHIDIVVTHQCNRRCPYCIDKFVNLNNEVVRLPDIEAFLKGIRKYTDKRLELLLLGGEPTIVGGDYLIQVAELVRAYGFDIIMSTNGINKNTIIECMPYFNSVQVTMRTDEEVRFWRQYKGKINIKLPGDHTLSYEKLMHFINDMSVGFYRKSVTMYFTPDFKELCTDAKVWDLITPLKWWRNGSYEYAFLNDIRFKKGIHGETNIMDEPTVPKLYPNGNYNKTWNHERLDDYLKINLL